MENKKLDILKAINKARNSTPRYCEDYGSLDKKGYDKGILRTMIADELIGWSGSDFYLTEKGEKILREERLIESLKINESFVKSIAEQAKMIESLALPKIDITKVIPQIDYSSLIPKIDFSKLIPDYSKMFQGLFKAIENINLDSVEKFQDKFPWLDFLSIGLALKLGELLEKESEEKVFEELFKITCESDFEDYLKKSFTNIPFLKNRIKIIQEGYKQHKEKNFIASVSILSPQIEGIIWDIGVFEGVVKNELNSKKIIDKKGRVIQRIRDKDIEWDLKHLILHLFGNDDAQTKYYYGVLYSNLRTPVTHGRKTDFDKLENSVTCLLLIMAMIEKIKELQESNEATK